MKLEPEWIGDLLGLWSRQDWHDSERHLGFPSVSPMFARAVGVVAETEEVAGYSSAELRAMTAGIEWLQLHHAEHYRALARELRPWARKNLEAKDGDKLLVLQAAKMLADYIDKVLD
jgi:hypothetical protein